MSQTSETQNSSVPHERRTLNEILITAIIFGFTLNLLSNLVGTLPALLSDQVLLLWTLGWGIGAFGLTAYLYIRLSRQYLGDDSHIEFDFSIAIVWDTVTGEIASRDTGYRPQIDAKDIFANLGTEKKNEIAAIIKNGPEALAKSNVPVELSEVILVSTIARLQNVIEGVATSEKLRNIFRMESRFTVPEFLDSNFYYFGKWVAKQNQVAKTREFEITLKRPYHGSIKYTFEMGLVDWFEENPDFDLARQDTFYSHEMALGMSELMKIYKKADPKVFSMLPNIQLSDKKPSRYIRSDVKGKIQIEFSPIYLQFGWGRTKILEPHLKSSQIPLLLQSDWITYRLMLSGADENKIKTHFHRLIPR